MVAADPVDLIEIECFRCSVLFPVCVRDYRGQRYCGGECRELGYRARRREAGRKYQGISPYVGRDRVEGR